MRAVGLESLARPAGRYWEITREQQRTYPRWQVSFDCFLDNPEHIRKRQAVVGFDRALQGLENKSLIMVQV